jgi:hypothetical protein
MLLSGAAAHLGANVRFNSSMLVCIAAKSCGLLA